MLEEGIADENETLSFLLSRTKRPEIPLRVAFVHHPRPGGGPGPLRDFLRRPETLDLYLLLVAVAVSRPYNVTFPAAVWARALGREGRAGELWVSKSLRWLEDRRLIVRRRVSRETEITLREDSERARPYTRPDGRGEWGRFIRLSERYFRDGYHKQLTVPGKAVLLIALCNAREFELPMRQGEKWWGMSAETLSSGLADLQVNELLTARSIQKKAPATRLGFTVVSLYRLLPPLSQHRSPAARSPRGSRRARRRGRRSP